MELLDAIHRRRAVRDYTDEPLHDAEIEALIHAAIQAPSAMDRQRWSFCVIRDQTLLTHISDQAKAHLLQTSPPQLASRHFEETLASPDFHIFYHAPAMILISAKEDDQWGTIDCALAAQNLMLAATQAGLGSCWIGFAQDWLESVEGKAAISLPPGYRPVAPIIVGHARGPAPPVPRAEPEVRWIN